MIDHGDPAVVVPPGTIVRIRMAGGLVYTSTKLTRQAAADLAKGLIERFRRFGGLLDLPEFPSAECDTLAIRADKVSAVEVRCVNGDGRYSGVTAAGTLSPEVHVVSGR